MAKVKVEAIKRYKDVVQNKIVGKGTVFEVSEERAKHLVKQRMVVIVKESKTEDKKG